MKRWSIVLLWLFSGWVGAGTLERPGRVEHVVMIQLKDPANTGRFMALSKRLADLPGVERYSVGPALPREDAGEENFDIGVVVTLENRQALYDYMRHPRHQEIIDAMRPLVKRVVVYDFLVR